MSLHSVRQKLSIPLSDDAQEHMVGISESLPHSPTTLRAENGIEPLNLLLNCDGLYGRLVLQSNRNEAGSCCKAKQNIPKLLLESKSDSEESSRLSGTVFHSSSTLLSSSISFSSALSSLATLTKPV